MMNQIPHVKKRIAVLASLTGMMAIFLIGLTVSMTYTYSSRAQGVIPEMTQVQDSITPVNIPSDELPQCVKFLQYLQTNKGKLCIVDMKCIDQSIGIRDSCHLTHDILECNLEAGICANMQSVIQSAATTCGCLK